MTGRDPSVPWAGIADWSRRVVANRQVLLEKLLLMVRDLGQERTFAYIRFLLGCEDND